MWSSPCAAPRACAVAIALLCVAPATSAGPGCGAADRPVIAEVYYDAIGDDSGYEFVELLNPLDTPWVLAGVRLEAGDGAAPGRWTLRWTGAARDTIAPHARFVIGGAKLEPAPQATVTLDLQNGPDAVRLMWPDGVSEVVGYGALEYPEYSCGAPAADAPSGMALARIPDLSRLGSNALDFRPAPPTPGRANQPQRDAALVAGSLALDPEQPDPGAATRVRASVTARGAQPLAAGTWSVGFAFGGDSLATAAPPTTVAPGETLVVEATLVFAAAGAGAVIAHVVAAGDENPDDDRDSLRVRIGPGPLAVTEIQFHPARDEGEWVEVRAWSQGAVDPAAFLAGDRAGARGAVAAPPGAVLAPGAYAVLAQDRARLLAAFPALDTTRVFAVAPWAALNNSDGDDGFADIVTIRERDGTPCARQPYRAAGVPAGTPLELGADGVWGPATSPAGTPLAAPVALAPLARVFEVTPRRAATGSARFALDWSLPWTPDQVQVVAYDLAGRRAAVALAPAPAAARAARVWNAPLPPGVYVLAFAARGAGARLATASVAVRITGVDP